MNAIQEDLFTVEGHLTSLTLDRYLLDDLEPEEREIVAQHLEECTECAEMLAQTQAFDASFFDERPNTLPSSTTSKEKSPVRRSLWMRPGFRAFVGVAVAASALLLFLNNNGQPPTKSGDLVTDVIKKSSPDVEDGIRLKGSAVSFKVFVHDGEKVRIADDEEVVHPGDRLGFQVSFRETGHIMIVGWDKGQEPYLGYPQNEEEQSERLEHRSGGVKLDAALELDDVLGTEHLMVLWCKNEFTFQTAKDALIQSFRENPSRTKPILKDCAQHETRLRKQEKP